MNITVFGPNGMLGQAVMKEAMTQGHSVNPVQSRIEDAITGQVRRSVVINCAGRVPQKNSTDANMVLSNAYGPQLLAEVCDLALVRLVHVSTDCVFSLIGPHSEKDEISPANLYGVSKAAGEITRDQHLTVRTSFIGECTHGLVHQLRSDKIIQASRGLLWSGHTVKTVAEYLVKLAVREDVTGLLHMPGEFTNRFAVAKLLIDQLGLDTIINEQSRSDFFADRRLVSNRWHKLALSYPPDLLSQIQAGGLL